jgi:hypothetical protein
LLFFYSYYIIETFINRYGVVILIKYFIPNMRHKLLMSFVVLFAVVLAVSTVSAFVDDVVVEINDVVASTNPAIVTVAGEVSEVVPIEVEFDAIADVSDVRVKVFIEGYKSEISEQTSRFHVIDGSRYVKRFSLRLPSSTDLDNLNEELLLIVRFSAKGESPVEENYIVKVQRTQYSLNVLSIDGPDKVSAGSSYVLDVVIENNGNEKLENIYLKASIPVLGLSQRVYVGDLDEQDERDFTDLRDIDRVDARAKRVILNIPRNVQPGTYDVDVEVFNFDTGVTVKKRLTVNSVDASILPVSTSKTIAVGEETTFDVVIVNPNDRIAVYRITPEESPGLIVDILEPVVTVSGDSSRTVKVRVKATDDVSEGTHVVRVNVNSESGLVEQVSFTANVEGKSSTGRSDAAFVLTVVLTIVFVVLLIILIVLLTRKTEEPEEFGETSYY